MTSLSVPIICSIYLDPPFNSNADYNVLGWHSIGMMPVIDQ
jgi:hypothetical protein